MEIATKFYETKEDLRELDNKSLHQLIKELIKKQGVNSLVEVGCGNGVMLSQYGNIDAVGVDVNKSMVEFAHLYDKNNSVYLEDITNSTSFFYQSKKSSIDVVCANYVFTEFTQKQLKKGFDNIYSLLNDTGKFCFTITNPEIRKDILNNKVSLGYVIEPVEEFDYKKEDLEFKVLLDDGLGGHKDVGIIDYHNPTKVYISLLEESKFKNIKIYELNNGTDLPHALLFEVGK